MTSDYVFRMLGAIAVVFLCSAAGVAESPMDCVEEITMPSVTMGMVTSLPATIEVHILIGKDGRAQKTDSADANAVLAFELNRYFRDETRYADACEGKTISFTVRYLVEGNATDRLDPSEVRFRPPNEFIVRIHPVRIFLDPVRAGSPAPPFCAFSLRFVDSDSNPIKAVSISTQPSAAVSPYEFGRVVAFPRKGEDLLATAVAPNYEPVEVHLSCPKEGYRGVREQFVIMTRK